MTWHFTPGEVAALGALGAVAIVGWQRPELAPATGLLVGGAGGLLRQHMFGFCLFREDECRRERVAAMVAGALIGAGVGLLRRDYERAR